MSGRIARGAMALVAAGLALAVPGRASAACQTYQANGSPWTTTTCDDGSRATTYRAPGSPWSTTTYDDGTSASTYESGDWITTTWSDGTRTQTYVGGNWSTTTGAGGDTARTYRAPGSPWTTTTWNDGSRAETYRAPGSSWTTTTLSTPDGSNAQGSQARVVSPPLASARRLATPTPVSPFGGGRTYGTSPGTAPSPPNRSAPSYGSGRSEEHTSELQSH